jgi:hypothetical protein
VLSEHPPAEQILLDLPNRVAHAGALKAKLKAADT